VTITKDGTFTKGKFLSTAMNSTGKPTRDDSGEKGLARVRELSKADFGDSAAVIGEDGSIGAPR
jgi:hypothetical protein